MSSTTPDATPVRVALVNCIEAVQRAVVGMLEPYARRVCITPLDGALVDGARPTGVVADVVLFDMHGGGDPLQRVRALVDDPRVAHVALFSAGTSPQLVDAALALGASAVLVRGGAPAALVVALERISDGHRVGLDHQPSDDTDALTDREQEVLLLLGLGMSNQEIGRELYLGVETVRTHVRQVLRKLGVTNRTQAALRASEITPEETSARASGRRA